jgi:hypothetical protein
MLEKDVRITVVVDRVKVDKIHAKVTLRHTILRQLDFV